VLANQTNRTIAVDAVSAIFTRFDAADVERLLKDDYIQHNPAVPTGRAAIVGFLPVLKESGITVTTHRVLAEGNFVVTHSTYANAKLFGADTLVAFDVFRIEDGKVAEHWDNLAPVAPANPSGRTQIDGPVEMTDLDKTTENKALVADFVESVLIGGNVDQAARFISQTTYHQHNTAIADGVDGLGAALAAMAKQGVTMKYDTLHLLVAEGNFVFTMSEGKLGGKPTAFFDLFRIQAGQIVEHWDIISDIPESMAHPNGKFGMAAKHTKSTTDIFGKSYKVDFGAFRFRLDFISPTEMDWSIISDNNVGQKNRERITVVEVRPGINMVYWSEKAGNRITHVEDFTRGVVHTNIAMADGSFLNLTGTLVELKD
jgi:predicted SnoaL-like aldol condensation-catalyzing enzyme